MSTMDKFLSNAQKHNWGLFVYIRIIINILITLASVKHLAS